jgi:hypothetical protein
MKSRFALHLAIIALLVGSAVMADTWERPRVMTYMSRESTYRVTVYPASTNPSTYPAHAVCDAMLEKLEKNTYRQLWRKPLVNGEAPVEILVAERSGHIVTFDEWGQMGYGDTVVVIYSPYGTLVRKLALGDLVTPAEIEAMPRTVSSILWRGEHRFSPDEELVEVSVFAGESWWSGPEFRKVSVRLSDGAVIRTDQ